MGEQVIFVTVENVYGRRTIRPECELSRVFCRLLKQKTLTDEDVKTIKELGYEIKTKEINL